MQVSKRLVVRKEIPMDNSKDLITSLDVAMAEYYCKNNDFDKGLKTYRDIIPQILDEAERNKIINQYMTYALQYAQKMFVDKKYISSIEQYREIMKFSGFPVTIYKNIGLCMKSIGNADLAIKFLKRFEEVSPDKEDVYVYLADLTYTDIKDNKKAIEYYETVNPKGEFVLVIDGYKPENQASAITIDEAILQVKTLTESGIKLSEACREIAAATGFKKSELYSALVNE